MHGKKRERPSTHEAASSSTFSSTSTQEIGGGEHLAGRRAGVGQRLAANPTRAPPEASHSAQCHPASSAAPPALMVEGGGGVLSAAAAVT